MKKLLLSMLVILMVHQGFGQKEIISLSFNAKDSITQNPLVLDSVYINNITLGCDTSLYNPVSDLSINILHVGINDPASENSASFTVMQNVPNPFPGSTLVRIYLKTEGALNLAVYNTQSKQLSEYHNSLVKGWHMFGVSTSGSQLLFLKVSDNTSTKTIKLLSTDAGTEGNRISYNGLTGQDHPILKSVQEETGFIFYLGNQLQFTAYADGYYESILAGNPESDETYTFAMLPVSSPTLPSVSTATVTNITQITATSGGDVTSDGGAAVTARGVCWSTSSNPTTAADYTVDGSGAGSFVSYLSGLTPGTQYYIRAYATNSVGTAYAEELTFPTLNATLPVVTSIAAYDIAQATALSGGNVTSDGGLTVTARGVCWSTAQTPTTAGSHTTDGSGMGSFVSNLTGLTPNTPYYLRAYATNSIETAYGNELTFTTLSLTLPTVTTIPASDITPTSATIGGNVTTDGGATVTARGVCWNTTQNPTIANSHTTNGNGIGAFVSNLTALTPNTPYYIRAYATNSVGTAYGNQVNFTTLPVSTCGSTLTINHVAGTVSPVDKTVTYGTVTNIPGEESKCWITSNLGADHQATAVDDATEPSAGWYWQFNRKQGYKHDGTTRTPNTTWISSISENPNCLPANDPCTIELGSGWRIPTKTEWTNVDASGNWTNWNGPWNSALKMHAAGSLIGGSLYWRGSYGYYWSSSQEEDAYSAYLDFGNYSCNMFVDAKSIGISTRCIKE